MLTLYRRHLASCPYTSRTDTDCSCPIHCDGSVEIGTERIRVRESMDTSSWARARTKMAQLEKSLLEGRVSEPFESACDKFLKKLKVAPETRVKYTRWVKFLKEFAAEKGITFVDQWNLELIDEYEHGREVKDLTWSKELQFLRQLFKFFEARKWIEGNPAKEAEMPSEPKPGERIPYTREEIARILSACEQYGRTSYERRRAKAMVLILRFYGLRISDMSTLAKDRIANGQLMVRAGKNGAMIWAPIYPEVATALAILPPPRGTQPDCPYFFWAGPSSSTAVNFVKTVERSLQAVFRRSGVQNAVPHRFRHTLVTELMAKGATVEDVANILGDDPDTVRKYYLKWSPEYQRRTADLLNRVHFGVSDSDTSASRAEIAPASLVFSGDNVVAKVGVELDGKTKKQ
jgi:site-specific recombinase XerD